jgi:CheY-like chemotaxis protein
MGPAGANGVRSVIVDDNDHFIAMVSSLLVADGFEVAGAAGDSAQGLRLVSAVCPDVALIDLCLGEENGLELIAELARSGLAATMFMILISTCAAEDLRAVCAGSAADAYLPKMDLSADAVRCILTEDGHGTVTADART